jgi:TetR/AcrR family transcriptional repressor of nem operon
MDAMPRTKNAPQDTSTRILDAAERLVQRRGYNGFSYADIATELKITTASLHYHFAGKAALGTALLARYAARFGEALQTIDMAQSPAPAKLAAYAELYASVLRDKRLCLCGMLAAEFQTLPKAMRDEVLRFFDDNEAWLARILNHGRSDGSLSFEGRSEDAAKMVISGLEGAMLVARPYGEVSRFQAAANQMLSGLSRGKQPVS